MCKICLPLQWTRESPASHKCVERCKCVERWLEVHAGVSGFFRASAMGTPLSCTGQSERKRAAWLYLDTAASFSIFGSVLFALREETNSVVSLPSCVRTSSCIASKLSDQKVKTNMANQGPNLPQNARPHFPLQSPSLARKVAQCCKANSRSSWARSDKMQELAWHACQSISKYGSHDSYVIWIRIACILAQSFQGLFGPIIPCILRMSSPDQTCWSQIHAVSGIGWAKALGHQRQLPMLKEALVLHFFHTWDCSDCGICQLVSNL